MIAVHDDAVKSLEPLQAHRVAGNQRFRSSSANAPASQRFTLQRDSLKETCMRRTSSGLW